MLKNLLRIIIDNLENLNSLSIKNIKKRFIFKNKEKIKGNE